MAKKIEKDNKISVKGKDNEKEKNTSVKNKGDEWKKNCCARIKIRDEKEYRDLISRLNRIEGQIRGIKGMVEKDSYCIDIITQVSAANAALNSFSKILLSEHIKTCVTESIKEGNEEVVDELVNTLQKMMK